MSLLDIRHAKEALAWRLKEWGVEDPATLAGSFIDDLIAKGWRMDAAREIRIHPPKAGEECATHPGQWAHNCGGCRADAMAEPERPESPITETTLDASLVRAELAAARARLCGCGVRRDACPVHREAAAAVEEDA